LSLWEGFLKKIGSWKGLTESEMLVAHDERRICRNDEGEEEEEEGEGECREQ
jgi:hypothetical protein